MRHQLLALVLVPACHTGMSGPTVDAENVCLGETRSQTFVVGLDNPGINGVLDFKLMSATPAPPSRGDNTWVVQINQLASGVDGAAFSGAHLSATPFMPDHQHGTPITVQITAMPTAGEYQLSPVNLWMPGYWETTVIATANGTSDSTKFRFCIPY